MRFGTRMFHNRAGVPTRRGNPRAIARTVPLVRIWQGLLTPTHRPMPKLLSFPARSVRKTATRLLRLTASRADLQKPASWPNRPDPPESLGNMLQRLVLLAPHVVLVLENIVAEMLRQIDPS
jgi:hypothetical protein